MVVWMRVGGSVAKLCLTLCDAMDCSPPGPSVHGFPRKEYWSGLPFPSPGDLLNPGIEPMCPALAGGFFTLSHLVVWMRKTINSMHNK